MNYNLLPWREAQAARRRFYRQVICWLGIGSLCVGVGWIENTLHEKVKILHQQSDHLQTMIESARQEAAKQVSVTASPSVHTPAGLYALLRSLFAALSDGVCFTSLHVQRASVLFHGRVNNDIALSHFLMAWPISSEFGEVRLQSLNNAPETNGEIFELMASLMLRQSRSNNDDQD